MQKIIINNLILEDKSLEKFLQKKMLSYTAKIAIVDIDSFDIKDVEKYFQEAWNIDNYKDFDLTISETDRDSSLNCADLSLIVNDGIQKCFPIHFAGYLYIDNKKLIYCEPIEEDVFTTLIEITKN